ncbi:uncharacterized protein DFL_000432 [Arthrobotrys flagrans]|uniref:Uncharacterized protein n=1 Tax=Arthrobotrys flagrans TaxID=97331 RepID=A0A437ADX9_ARTFL|nr:hypothetical protein DFL_000432 [Arthrobotrys flagrans]
MVIIKASLRYTYQRGGFNIYYSTFTLYEAFFLPELSTGKIPQIVKKASVKVPDVSAGKFARVTRNDLPNLAKKQPHRQHIKDVVFCKALGRTSIPVTTHHPMDPPKPHTEPTIVEKKRVAPTILDILNANLEPCYSRILNHLDLPDILRLFSTCKTIHSITYCIFNIDAHLREFFKDPVVFRQTMADNNLLVSGSTALKFFTRDKWTTKDLDVYTNSEESLKKTADVLEKQGFGFVPFPWQGETIEASLRGSRSNSSKTGMEKSAEIADREAIREVLNYVYDGAQIEDVFRLEKESQDLHIDIILTRGPALLAILEGYYSTYIMNFFTYNRAYNLFPYHTVLQKEGFLSLAEISDKRQEAIQKYLNRGYKITEYGRYHTCKMRCPLRPHRRVGDMFTWIVDLPINDIRLPANPIRLENYTFCIHGHKSYKSLVGREYRSMRNIRIEMDVFQHKNLEFPLLVDNTVSPGGWKEFLQSMMDRVVAQEEGLDVELADPLLQRDIIVSGVQRYCDRDIEGYYNFWYQYIMPRETLWKGRCPMLE